MKKKIVIVGATSSIAEHCARLWCERGEVDFVLVGRSDVSLQKVKADLAVRFPASTAHIFTLSFLEPSEVQSLIDRIYSNGPVDLVLIAQGELPHQLEVQRNLVQLKYAIEVNALSVIYFLEGFATQMERVGKGQLIVLGSVAGDRGRKSNYIYGSAKSLVETYTQGLQHRFYGSKIRVVLVKPGPTDTKMTAHLKKAGQRLAPVADVAQEIVAGIDAGKSVIYAPKVWKWVMLVVRLLPSRIFNRLNL